MTAQKKRGRAADTAPTSQARAQADTKLRGNHSANGSAALGEESANQRAARWLYSLGLIPIRIAKNSKKAIDKGWPDTSYASADEAASAFTGHHGNIGFTMPNNFVVVDVDQKNGVDGGASWHGLHERLGLTLKPTLTFKTPSGGRHYVYRLPRGVGLKNAVGIVPGVDLKTYAGYVVTAPSRIGDAEYCLIDGAVDD